VAHRHRSRKKSHDTIRSRQSIAARMSVGFLTREPRSRHSGDEIKRKGMIGRSYCRHLDLRPAVQPTALLLPWEQDKKVEAAQIMAYS